MSDIGMKLGFFSGGSPAPELRTPGPAPDLAGSKAKKRRHLMRLYVVIYYTLTGDRTRRGGARLRARRPLLPKHFLQNIRSAGQRVGADVSFFFCDLVKQGIDSFANNKGSQVWIYLF